MQIAIHHREGSFSEKWIMYCREHSIRYKIVDCYSNNIIEQLNDCEVLMWHFHHASAQDFLFAKQLLHSIEFSGKKVFPDINSCWHFDDKVGQKYLLESLKIAQVPTYVFYDEAEALHWVHSASFPKVFKLRSGAGSAHVRLVTSRREAAQLVKQAFGNGFRQYNGWSNFKERLRKYKKGKTSFWDVFKGLVRLFYNTQFSKVAGREKGYIYFQDFIENNDSDIRVIVVGNKAFAIRRMIRENDFRASGSGDILYDREQFDLQTIKLSFDIAGMLKTQSVAFDFLSHHGQQLLVEISYAFTVAVYEPCTGYWDEKLNWHPGKFNPYGWMVENLLERESVS